MNIKDDADILVGYVATALDNKAWDKARAKIVEYLHKYNNEVSNIEHNDIVNNSAGSDSDKEFNKFFDELKRIEQEEMLKKPASVLLAESERPFYAACLKAKEIEKENAAFKQANETLLKTSLNQEAENDKLDGLNMALDLENKEQEKIIQLLAEALESFIDCSDNNEMPNPIEMGEYRHLIKKFLNEKHKGE